MAATLLNRIGGKGIAVRIHICVRLLIDGLRPYDQQCVSMRLLRGVALRPRGNERARAASGYFFWLVNAFTNCLDVKGSARKFSDGVS